MEGLNQTWTEKEVDRLSRELWMLNSPLPRFGKTTAGERGAEAFQIEFSATLPGFDETFAERMQAAISDYAAVIEGELQRDGDKSKVHVGIRFKDGETFAHDFEVPGLVEKAKWQVRIYDLVGRQASGLSVGEIREYFERYGVMMFDAGFRLPYYGIDSDWLRIDFDHAHRRSRSKLLPAHLQVERGLNDLPTQGRMLGVVSIDTGREAAEATAEQSEQRNHLQILVTRDRLVENEAYEVLRDAVRASIDFYATRKRLRVSESDRIFAHTEAPIAKIRRIDGLIREAREKFPSDDTVSAIKREFDGLDEVIALQEAADDSSRALLGPLAAAGMAAIALDHELRREIARGKSHLTRLSKLALEKGETELVEAAAQLEGWLEQFELSRQIFSPLVDQEDRETVGAYRVHRTIEEVKKNLRPLLPGISIETEIDKTIRFPNATYAEWHALFQNVITNAANAIIDNPDRTIGISGGHSGRRSWVRISDRGPGIDLGEQSDLFEPFYRSSAVSEERQALGLGGMGLGLTIVRMIADQRGCEARFVEPEAGWNTTFEITWMEALSEDSDL